MSWQTLGEWVWGVVRSGETDSVEFQAALNYYGREKLLTEYRRERDKRLKEEALKHECLDQVQVNDDALPPEPQPPIEA